MSPSRIAPSLAVSLLMISALCSTLLGREAAHEGEPEGKVSAEPRAADPHAPLYTQNAAIERGDLLPRVEELLATHDCLACHAPDASLRWKLDPVLAPVLQGVTRRSSADWLISFLQDPRAARPGSTHPHQLISIPDNLRESVAVDLTHYFHSLDGGDGQKIPMESGSIASLESGRKLFHEIGCAVCHGPQESADDLSYSIVDLTQLEPAAVDESPVDAKLPPGILKAHYTELPIDLARKGNVRQLTDYLLDPLAQRPGGFCPSMSLEKGEARAIASYLLRHAAQRVDGSYERRPGLSAEVYHAKFTGKEGGSFGLLRVGEPVSREIVRGFGLDLDRGGRDDLFGVRFSGLIAIPTEGEYTFFLNSDDGSRLFVSGAELLDNGGNHAAEEVTGAITLEAGLHSIVLEYYEGTGDEVLSLQWSPPGSGIEGREDIPAQSLSHWPLEYRVRGSDGLAVEDTSFTLDAVRAERGARAFNKLGCASCHSGIIDPGDGRVAGAPSLEQLNGVRPGVLICLRAGRRYEFDQDTVGLLLSAFVDADSIASDAAKPSRAVERYFARRNCYGCHQRDGVGGVHPSLMGFFTGDEDAELGDQGRFPPTLSGVGRKFRPSVLLEALQGEERVRPYLNTRMPKMGESNVERLAERLKAADLPLASLGDSDADTDGAYLCEALDVDGGRRLAGDRGGLGCVQCHGFLGTKSLGVRAIDMGEMHRRLRFEWFAALLKDPASVDMASRMATFWIDGASPVEDIADGDIDRQIQALWCWLGEEEVMAPPPGLDSGPWAFEVDPSKELRLVSVFMKDVSPNVLCIGSPEGIHMAFDVENGRLAKAWRGRFLNALGTWQGRAGALESPGSKDVVDLLEGFAVAPIKRLNSPWPTAYSPTNPRGLTTRALGRTVHPDGAVTMRYTVGGLRVSETLRPTRLGVRLSKKVEPETHLGVERVFEIRMPRSGVGQSVVARVATARLFDRAGTGKWRINGRDWPVYAVDKDSVRTAKLVEPKADVSSSFGSSAGGRPSADGRNRVRSREAIRGGENGPGLTELRIPILMVPADDGTDDLVGTFSWSYAW